MTVQLPTASSINPHDGRVIQRYPFSDGASVEAALERAFVAQQAWTRTTFGQRAAVLRAVAAELRAEQERLAQLVTAEMGKTLVEARAEVLKSASACDYYADRGEEHLAPEVVETEWSASEVQFPPLGVVLAIMPWNFPVWQVVRGAAPALMAGNTMILKHAPNVTGTALLIHELFARVSPSLLELLVLDTPDIAAVIADSRVAAVTLTGSGAAGIKVATVCAQHLKPSVLELGGSDPFVVLADADVEAAARAAVTARFSNAGQSCVAAKRFIVVEAVGPTFEEAFVAATEALVMGDPRGDVNLGPLARIDLRDAIGEQVRAGLREGGRLLTGGTQPDSPGAYYTPTVVAVDSTENTLATDETFGPVAAVLRVPDEATAITVANATPYGLSSSIWTEDVERGRSLAAGVAAGGVFINATTVSDPRMPFGGIKHSGWGRELGAFGIREFVNVQTVVAGPKRS